MHLLYVQQLLVLPGLPGNDRCWQFATQWAEAGHRITFVSSDALLPENHPWKAPRGGFRVIAHQGVEIHLLSVAYSHQMPFWRRSLQFMAFYQKAWRYKRKIIRPDVVLAYTAPLSVGDLGRKLARYYQVPFFYEVADVWPDVPIEMGLVPFGPLQSWLQKRTQRIYDAATHIFPFSTGMKQQIESHDVPAAKITPIPNGADLIRTPFQERTEGERVNVLYMGTIGVANDLGQLVAAWEQVEAVRPHAHLHIIGQGNDLPRVKALASQRGLVNIVFRASVAREEALQLLVEADIGVVCFAAFPILQTNAATKFFDYLASGLPMVINYQGWQADVLQTYQCGLSAPQGDPKAFATQLIRLIDDSALRHRCEAKGREVAVSLYDRQKLAAQMIDIIVRNA